MATDRSTLPRGPSATADYAVTPPSGRRVPGAPRERKTLLAALALLLAVGGAAVSALLVVKTGHKVPAIEISQDVAAGQRIPLDAMREVQVSADSGLPFVAWGDRLQVSQYPAASAIPAGTLLTGKMVARGADPTAGRQIVSLALKPGQIPARLQAGDHVDVYDTNTTSQNTCPGAPGTMLTQDAIVTSVAFPGSSSGSSDATADIAIDPSDAGLVACNAANGWAAIGIVPPGGGQGQPSAAPASPGVPAPAAPRPGFPKKRRTVPPAGQATPAASPAGPAPPGTA